ncbi:MAG: hypothetical protein J7521_22770 [Caulobacter sp.]|nr:hypothetical protein [Caulobacter sp.]
MNLSTTRRNRIRNGVVLAGSVLLHAALLTVLAWPTAQRFLDLSNDEDAITVTLERRELAQRPSVQAAASPQAAAAPLQPRAPRLPPPAYVPTLGVAPAPGPPSPVARPAQAHPAPLPEGPGGDLKAALRASSVGCANADAVGLNRREREHCDDVFGAQAKGRTFDAPLDPAKQREFEAQALRQQALRNYWNSPTVGVDHRNRDNPGKGKDIPWVLGASQDGLGRERSAESQALKRLSDAEKAEERRKKAAREAEGR